MLLAPWKSYLRYQYETMKYFNDATLGWMSCEKLKNSRPTKGPSADKINSNEKGFCSNDNLRIVSWCVQYQQRKHPHAKEQCHGPLCHKRVERKRYDSTNRRGTKSACK
mmetsp:Transcript_26944/g.49919  ORF Transcript_26944/g.49919 Transcript_26944/m.49919 type:complete len:109 (-) Transcript_26944:562-888(-)